jgi:hypothetical protein
MSAKKQSALFDFPGRTIMDRHMVSMNTSKLILSGDFQAPTPTSREKMIEEFLKNWLTDKQRKGMGLWYTEMLDAFMTEVLLSAQKVGIEKLLLHGTSGNNSGILEGFMKNMKHRESNRFPLAIVSKPIKPKISGITLEEVNGDLASDTKSVLLSDVKTERVDHAAK